MQDCSLRHKAQHLGADNVQGYYAGLSGDGKTTLGHMNNDWTPLKQVKVFDTIDPNRYYHMKVITYQNDIKVYVNDSQENQFSSIRTIARRNIPKAELD